MGRIPIIGGDAYTTEVQEVDLSGVALEATAQEIRGGRHGYPDRELFYWPCINGERYAPTFGGTGNPVYTRYRGWPCIRWDTNVSAIVATYPYIPRSAPGKPVMRFRWKWARDSDLAKGRINLKTLFLLKQINSSASLHFQTGPTETTTIADIFPLGDITFKDFEVVLSETDIKLYVGGVLKATHVTDIWPTTLDSTPRLELQGDSAAGSAYKSYVTLLEVEYE